MSAKKAAKGKPAGKAAKAAPASRATRPAGPPKRARDGAASGTASAAVAALRKAALAYPGAWEDHPWGESVYKVGKKIFLFAGAAEGGMGISVKLPRSSEAALTMFSFASPTGYGLGKAGWVSCRFARGEKVPIPLLLEWVEESYRAVAPARLSRTVPSGGPQSKAG